MKGLALACCLTLAAVPGIASAQNQTGTGGAAGDAGASYSSLSPTTWGLISAGVVATVAGVAVAVNSGGNGGGSTTTTTTTTATTTSN